MNKMKEHDPLCLQKIQLVQIAIVFVTLILATNPEGRINDDCLQYKIMNILAIIMVHIFSPNTKQKTSHNTPFESHSKTSR